MVIIKYAAIIIISVTTFTFYSQNLSVSSGLKFGLDIEGRVSGDSYNFIKNDVVSQYDFGGYIDLRYRFSKRHNWHLKVGAEISRLSFYQRIIDERLSGQEYPAVKMFNNWAAASFGVHKYFNLYDGRLMLDIGLAFQFRKYFKANKKYYKINFDYENGINQININELYVDYEIETKIESFSFSPEIYCGIKYPINQFVTVNLGVQLSYPHFIESRYRHAIRYYDPYSGSTNSGYGYGILNTNSAFTFLYINSGITMTIPSIRPKKNEHKL